MLPPVATFVLIAGAGSTPWYWHLVEPLLREYGHDTIAPHLPVDDVAATFEDYAQVVIDTIGDRRDRDDIVLVAQSLGGYTAPLVADRLAVRLIVMVAAMVPVPGESAGEYWAATGAEQARIDLARADGRNPDDMDAMFLHDVPEAVVLDGQAHLRNQSGTPFEAPFPLAAWPDVPTRFLLCRDDRFFPADLLRRIVPERLGITPDEMEGGHLPALAHPDELARRLHDYAEGR